MCEQVDETVWVGVTEMEGIYCSLQSQINLVFPKSIKGI